LFFNIKQQIYNLHCGIPHVSRYFLRARPAE
jgi:hypothetical protein